MKFNYWTAEIELDYDGVSSYDWDEKCDWFWGTHGCGLKLNHKGMCACLSYDNTRICSLPIKEYEFRRFKQYYVDMFEYTMETSEQRRAMEEPWT